MKSAVLNEQNYQFKTKVDMENKFSITEKLRHFLYCLLAIVLWFRYSPDRISLINDDAKCNRYGYEKYHKENDKYPHYNIHRYFRYPFPMWLNKWYFKHCC